MGVGKSTVSKILSEKLKLKVVSTDEWVERKEGVTIKEIFKAQGEAAFRQMESDAVKQIATLKGVIIDCGGGIPLNEENMALLRQKGLVIYLQAKPETILKNIKNQKHRPLLMDAKDPLATIKEILGKRQAAYNKADHTVCADNVTLTQLAEKILKVVNDE